MLHFHVMLKFKVLINLSIFVNLHLLRLKAIIVITPVWCKFKTNDANDGRNDNVVVGWGSKFKSAQGPKKACTGPAEYFKQLLMTNFLFIFSSGWSWRGQRQKTKVFTRGEKVQHNLHCHTVWAPYLHSCAASFRLISSDIERLNDFGRKTKKDSVNNFVFHGAK